MKHLKIFENFESNEFPDSFGRMLKRGVKLDKDEYIDDPANRKVFTGPVGQNEDLMAFFDNLVKVGNIPDPRKSVNMYLRPDKEFKKMIDYYGTTYDVFPKEGAVFGFNKELRNGGVGSLWFFPGRTSKDFLGIDQNSFVDYEEDPETFIEEITEYQKNILKGGVVGKLTYQELMDLVEKEGPTLQIWTEYPCLHKKEELEVKPPKPYKSEPLLTVDDFTRLGIPKDTMAKFYSQNGVSLKSSNREEALEILKNWKRDI